MPDTTSVVMRKFAFQHPKSAKLEYRRNSEFLAIDCPSTLAAFYAFCNGQSADWRIFLRGCTENHATAYPSLFRRLPVDDSVCERTRRWQAYKDVLLNLQNLEGRRWRRKDLGAVLQHYGVKTPWLDVVRNLYSAIWFAAHELRGSGLAGEVKPTAKDYCWISFFRRRAQATGRRLRVKDISAHHSSAHLRPHAQHGSSLAMQKDDVETPHPCQDFNTFRIAQIRIPNGTEWKLSGFMASTAFMFPSRDLDNSLQRLSIPEVQEILDGACSKFSIRSGTLGKISSYH